MWLCLCSSPPPLKVAREVEEEPLELQERRAVPRLILVRWNSPNRCVFEHAASLTKGCFGVSLTLRSHKGKAVVLRKHESFTDDTIATVPLGIGDAGDAVCAHYDGTNLIRSADGNTMSPYNVSYHEGNTMILGSGRASEKSKALVVNADGTISPAENPGLCLGVELAGTPMSGFWLSRKDGFQLLTIVDGIGHSTDGFTAKLTNHAEGFVFLEYEWGENFYYTQDDQGNLLQRNGFMAWEHKLEQVGKTLISEYEQKLNCNRRDKLASLISSGTVALVRGSYFEECLSVAKPYLRRQLVPKEYVWDGEEAVRLWQKHGRMFLVIVSYGWLTASHPDPQCFHLWRIVGVLRRLKGYFARYGVEEIAVILDFCALWQPEREGRDGAKTDSRTEEQKDEFKKGLGSFTDFYIHQHVTAVKMTGMPPGTERGYEERGWTLCESILIDSKSGVGNRLTFGNEFDPELEDSTGYGFVHKFGNQKCCPPVTPDNFSDALRKRGEKVKQKNLDLFVVASDADLVPVMYRSSFEFLRNSATLSYLHSNWDDSDIDHLAAALKDAKIEKLSLNNNRMTDRGLKTLVDALLEKKLIKRLRLDSNLVGPSGADYLSTILRNGKLPSLVSLSLGGNPMCENASSCQKLADAWVAVGKNRQLLDLGMGNLMLAQKAGNAAGR